LVVEEDRKPAAFIGQALQAGGLVVDASNRGEEAWTSSARTSFDAVIPEFMLAGGDGLGVLRQMCAPANRASALLLAPAPRA
jgi:DNA-binding response OmpR family regulator